MDYLTKKAKVLKKHEDDTYEVGFTCPDCPTGYITTNFKSNTTLNVGDVVEVQIRGIMFNYAPKVELVQDEPDNMPDIIQEAQAAGLVNESVLENSQSMVHDNTVQQMVVQQSEGGKLVVLEKYDSYIPKMPPISKKPKADDGLISAKVKDIVTKYTMYKLKDKESGEEFVGMANVELEVDTIANEDTFEKLVKAHPMHDYTLLHHWWGNAEQFDHYDLFINTEPTTHFVFQKNPLKETEFKAQQREPYSDDFMQKGETVEDLPPGSPGNPSKTLSAKVERIDAGKIAIYENEQQILRSQGTGDPYESWVASVEFFGQKMEGRWSLSSTVPRIWDVLKETVKLTEEFPVKLAMDGSINGWSETKDGLLIEGTALSFGVWNGMYWSPDVIRNSPLSDFDNLVIDVEHERSRAAGAVLENELRGTDIYVKGLIKDYETIEKIKRGDLKGFSIDATVFGDPRRRMVTRVKQYKRLTVCANPACRVCNIGNDTCNTQ